MATFTISFADLPDVYSRLPKRDHAAVHRALKATAEFDAQRWIQWAIRGGGYTSSESEPAQSLKSSKKPRGKRGKAEAANRSAAYRVPIDTGDYAASWRTAVFGETYTVYSAANPPVKAGVIELGRRPAFIPIEPLAQWVRRKMRVDDGEARSIAFAISISASRKRRAGLGVLARAHPKIVEAAVKNVERELLRSNKVGP